MQIPNRQIKGPRHNRFLATLPDAEWGRWHSLLEPVELRRNQVLYDAFRAPTHAFFPTTAIVSLVNQTRNGTSIEIAVIGNDGMVGISPFTSDHTKSMLAVVQSAGHGYRICARAVTRELNQAGPLLTLLLRYLNAMLAQVAQTALCNRFHSIDEQVCRRLLLGQDRASSNELVMTQQELANLLGVRREGVTTAAQKLQRDGVISYRRGSITVLDRLRLEQRACDCYMATHRETDRLLSVMPARDSNSIPAPFPSVRRVGAYAP